MNFDIPEKLAAYLGELDDFIEREIKPLENQDDNIRFFDHRREDARTDWERGGLPNEKLGRPCSQKRASRADAAGHFRYPLPEEIRRGAMGPISAWRSFASIWRTAASASTTTSRMNTRSWATTSACC